MVTEKLPDTDEGYEKAIRLLLNNAVGFEAGVDIEDILPFRTVCSISEVVQSLLENGADMTAKTSSGWTVLHWAASKGHETLVQTLLERGVDVRARDNSGQTALHDAVLNGHKAIIALLIEYGEEVEAS
jgi:ankyrin repeat protein